MKALVSVIMPTYNVVDYVEEAVVSIIEQTYKKIELIVVDDCSTDGTYEKLVELAKSDSRVKLYRNEKNLKICKTLNRALSVAQGEYIARMDGDDICDAVRLDRLLNYLEQHPNIGLVGSWIYSIDNKGRRLAKKKFLCSSGLITRCMYLQDCVLHIWLARRNVYDKLGGYREIPYAEDYDFLLRGLHLGFKYANIPEYLYSVRTRQGNTASTVGLKQQKCKYFVRKLNKQEVLENMVYDETEYLRAIACTEEEEKKYEKAYSYLKMALESRQDYIKMSLNVIKATCSSKYIFFHLFETVTMRFAIFLEKIIYVDR